MSPGRSRAAAALAIALAWPGPAPVALAQQNEYRAPSHITATHASLQWILGRFRRPLTCERADGSRVEIEESVVFRPAVDDRRGETVKATFFGIDVAGAERCYNVLEPEVPDRRGVLFITFLAHDRPDIGLSQLRRELEDGELSYHVLRGRLRVRALGDDAAEPSEHELTGRRAELIVRLVPPASDAGKLLARHAADQGHEGAPLRRLEIELVSGDASLLRAHYLEDGRRWR